MVAGTTSTVPGTAAVRVAIAAETAPGERRVAATPETCRKLIALGAQVRVQRGAGRAAGFVDEVYEQAGVALVEDLDGTLDGADLVFHLAAHARAWAANPEDFEAINVEGTRHVVSAARAAGVRRVVHVSTELVDGDQTHYQRTKRAAEQVVQDYIAQGGDAVIVRPTRVYGPGPLNPANSATRVIALYRRGLFRVRIADQGARANYVYVDDVVNGLLQAAECGARGAAYVLGGENLTISQLLDLVAQVTGRRHRVPRFPHR